MDFFFNDVMGKPFWMWAFFLGVVTALLIFDIGILHRHHREITIRESLKMSVFYIIMALLFGAFVWETLGAISANQYVTGYIVEETLSMDNILIMSLIFNYFAIPQKFQHRVLFWGIVGVIVLRGIMIGVGAVMIAKFHWVLYIFAAFLIVTGVKMVISGDHEPDIEKNWILKTLRRHVRITKDLHGKSFFMRQMDPATGKIVTWCTPLFITLVLIEFVDLVFAVDSVPAIFGITADSYIVYTSNIFAILGLRSLYFALAAVIHRFTYLKQALALVLIFIGGKTFATDMMGWHEFPASVSLGVTIALLASGIVYSLYKTRGESHTGNL